MFTLSDLLLSVLADLETRGCFLETPGLEIVNPKSILLYRVLMLILFTLSDLLLSVLPDLETRGCFLETPGLEIVNPKIILI